MVSNIDVLTSPLDFFKYGVYDRGRALLVVVQCGKYDLRLPCQKQEQPVHISP